MVGLSFLFPQAEQTVSPVRRCSAPQTAAADQMERRNVSPGVAPQQPLFLSLVSYQHPAGECNFNQSNCQQSFADFTVPGEGSKRS